MKDFSDLLKSEYVRNWLIGFHKHTRWNYLRFLESFCEYSGKDPDQLMNWVRQDRTMVHLKVKEFYEHLSKNDPATSNRSMGYNIIRSFFYHNDYPLGRAPRKVRKDSKLKVRTDRLLKPLEVSEMIGAAPHLRSKAVISFLAQSGQRTGLLTGLRYGAVRAQIEQGISPIVIEYTSGEAAGDSGRNKTGVSYRFAIGKESRDYLMRYMNYRRHKGEQINDKSWLFMSITKVQKDSKGRFLSRETPWPNIEPNRTNPQFINWIVVTAAYKAGIQVDLPVRWARANHGPKILHEVHAYSLRVFWKRQMREGGVADSDLLRYIMGEAPLYDGAYDKFDVDYVRGQG